MTTNSNRPNLWFREELLKKQPIKRIDDSIIEEQEKEGKLTASSNEYKRFQIPPDIDLCLVHQKATSFGFNNLAIEEECPCCHEYVKLQLSFGNASEKNIYKINEPVGFYFTFIKMMLLGLLAVILIPGIYSVVTIVQKCSNDTTNCDYVYGIPFPRLETFYTTLSVGLNAITILLLYVLVGFLFYWNVLIHEKISSSAKKIQDEHSLIGGFDSERISEEYFLEYLKEYGVKEVMFTYKIKDIMELLSRKNKLEALKHKYYQDGKEVKEQKMKAKIKEIDDKLIPIKNKFSLNREKELRTDKVFLKFKSKINKNQFEEHYKQNVCETVVNTLCGKSKLEINNCQLYVLTLGDPRQIIWQNLQVSSFKKYVYIILNNIIMVILLGLSFFAVLRLTIYEEQYKESSDYFLSVLFSVVLIAVNMILAFYIQNTTNLEGRYNMTAEIESKIIKKILVYFLNSTLIPFSLLIIESYRPIESEEDIVRNILTLFLISNIVSPLVAEFVQVGYLIKIFQRYMIKRQGKQCLKTQIKANTIFEKFDFNLEDRYSSICQRLAMCFFYAGIFPVGALITSLGLIITYFIGKNMLIRFCSIPKSSFRLGILITRIAALFPFIYSLGFVLNLYTYNQDIAADFLLSIILVVLTIPVSLIYLVKGHDIAKKFINPSQIAQTTIAPTSAVTYKDLNPATFFLSSMGQAQEDIKPEQILANMMNFSVFRDAVNVWKTQNRNKLNNQIQEMRRQREKTM